MSSQMHVAQGEGIALDEILAGNLILDLWTAGPNSNNPAKADVEGQYTLAAGSGYAAKTLTGGMATSPAAGWTKSGSNPTIAQYNIVQVFTFSAAIGPILGYILKRSSDSKLRYVFKFTDPWSGVNVND